MGVSRAAFLENLKRIAAALVASTIFSSIIANNNTLSLFFYHKRLLLVLISLKTTYRDNKGYKIYTISP
jgi:hypothetical protein